MIQRCIYCLSPKVVRNGHTGGGAQRYKCNDCGRRFCEKGFFARYKYSPKEITNAVYLKMKRQTSREVRDTMLLFFGTKISHATVCSWFKKFVGMINTFIPLILINFTKIWMSTRNSLELEAVKKFWLLGVPSVSESLQGVVGVSKANGEVKTNSGGGNRRDFLNKIKRGCF